MTKKIELTRGKFALVDDEDYPALSQHKWHCTDTGYACRRTYKPERRWVRMHRAIMNAPEGMEVDHVNGDKLDNRKCNLRLASHQENGSNQRHQKRPKTSKYKGVSLGRQRYKDKVYTSWRAYIVKDDKQIWLGGYETETAAARAYDKAARELHGPFAKLNFPNEKLI